MFYVFRNYDRGRIN